MKPLCNDLDAFPSLALSIGDFSASQELNCRLYYQSSDNFSLHPKISTPDDFYNFNGGFSFPVSDIFLVISVLSVAYLFRSFL